jgi:chromosome segregation ATPase
MKPIYRRILIFVVAIVVIAGVYFGYRLLIASQRSVPQEFSEARSQGAAVSEKIVSNSNQIASLVAQLGSPTSTPKQVSSTLGEVTTKVSQVRGQAVELAGTLEQMTKAVQDIRSEEARQFALDAISNRLTLVSHLITYTDAVSRLAIAIRQRLETGARNSGEIDKLIKEINAEIAAVNRLSSLADEAMFRFDELLR